MSLLTQVSNKVQYSISQWASDPDADAYAKEQSKQATHDAELNERLNNEKEKSKTDAEEKEKAESEAESLRERGEFKTKRVTSNVAFGIIRGFMNFIFTLIVLYGGHLAANEAIGYNVPFRILSFICGCIFFFIQIPKMLISRYWYEIKPAYYTYLPISTYQPNGDLEVLFLGGFCYKEDDASALAKATVETLYKTAFEKSR